MDKRDGFIFHLEGKRLVSAPERVFPDTSDSAASRAPAARILLKTQVLHYCNNQIVDTVREYSYFFAVPFSPVRSDRVTAVTMHL
jgi:hypothetical protein